MARVSSAALLLLPCRAMLVGGEAGAEAGLELAAGGGQQAQALGAQQTQERPAGERLDGVVDLREGVAKGAGALRR